MNSKNANGLHTFLKSLNKYKLLTKQEERELLYNIENYQNEVVQIFIKYKFSREILIHLLTKEDDISKLSRLVPDNKNNKKIERRINKVYLNLLKSLESADNYTRSRDLLLEFKLCGNVVYHLIKKVREHCSGELEVGSDFSKFFKFFEVDDVKALDSLTKSLLNKKDLMREFCKANFSTPRRIEILIKEFEYTKKKNRKVNKNYKKTYQKVLLELNKFDKKIEEYRNELIQKNLRLVVSRAKRFLYTGYDFEDLIQEGTVGLMKAIDKFDSSKNTKVSTYAIGGSIKASNVGLQIKPKQYEFLRLSLIHI